MEPKRNKQQMCGGNGAKKQKQQAHNVQEMNPQIQFQKSKTKSMEMGPTSQQTKHVQDMDAKSPSPNKNVQAIDTKGQKTKCSGIGPNNTQNIECPRKRTKKLKKAMFRKWS